ncbi:putative membrane protein YhjE [Weizmannia acidilactici]|uniref:TVP38/TMEM64 family membrane protein n=1 Tax=Weizmannia acidilactici TaxID=2607726 RepID=A0A5J4JKI0_9BACI|nr:TVP38/TMEM64 family protein [Weizmannia acidilactici]GER65771.1 putative membrane protein YhjE [Weizmannia acidilactici]GER70857.1 putative membrane protein YhjE [Weizmannia acidilactici]GER72675.1 putative membrane protein YhjE [Weizmannia acidilactici]
MNLELLKDWLTMENFMQLMTQYRSFGPILGTGLLVLEAFLPFLPMVLIVMANANAFGLWLGFLLSWFGACTGAFLVFLSVRKYGQSRFLAFLKTHRHVKKLMDWLDRHGFAPLFVLLCFPFTPSAVVNIVAGLSAIRWFQYLLAVFAGKMITIFIISFIGHDIASLLKQPLRTGIVLLAIAVLWFVGKRVEARLSRKIKMEQNQS